MEKAQQIEALERKLAASEQMGAGYADRCSAIRIQIEKLKQ